MAFLPETPEFLDPKLLSSVREIMAKVMLKYPSPEFVLKTIQALHDNGYVEIVDINPVVKTIRKKRNGFENK